jgi:hypothetical protein
LKRANSTKTDKQNNTDINVVKLPFDKGIVDLERESTLSQADLAKQSEEEEEKHKRRNS